MTTTPKRSLQRGVLSLLESAAWSASPWRSLREIKKSIGERGDEHSPRAAAHELYRQCLEKLARRGLVEMKSENGAPLYRAVLSPLWSFATKEPRVCGGAPPLPTLGSGGGTMAQ